MIAVVADDLSGATELAGAAVEAGFSAEVQAGVFTPATDADVVAITTESRTRAPNLDRVREIAQRVVSARPEWIYKKTDSVLRGHVAPEISVILRASGLTNSLLIPANPGKRRTISQGGYFVDGQPLNATAFANDPEFPRRSSDVVELARAGVPGDSVEFPVCWIGKAPIPAKPGIFIPEMTNPDQMRNRARELDWSRTLPAGGVEFFQANLGSREKCHDSPPKLGNSPSLFVCGSFAAWEMGRAGEFEAQGVPVVPMPAELFANPGGNPESWVRAVSGELARHGIAALAIGSASSSAFPESLTRPLAEAVRRLVAGGAASRLFVEGGATAAAIIQALGWNRFAVQAPAGPGIARLQPFESGACTLFVKPGSYPWPDLAKMLASA